MDWEIDDPDSPEDDNGRRRCEGMDALLFTVALEVALLQMQIVEGCAALRKAHLPAEPNSSLYLLRKKLVSDRKLVTDIIRASLVEMAGGGTWRCLQKAINILNQRASEYSVKMTNHNQLRRTYISTRKDLKDQMRRHIEDLRQADKKITVLRDKKEDDRVNAKFRLSYAERWLAGRSESLQLRHGAPRAALPTAAHEQRIHHEVQRSYQLLLVEREKAVEFWRLKYADDTAKINVLLAEKREQLNVTIARREELQTLFNLHEGEMRSWLDFKRERAARLAREARNRDAATRVQSWWRGEMVRRALGPFKSLRHAHAKKSATKTKKK